MVSLSVRPTLTLTVLTYPGPARRRKVKIVTMTNPIVMFYNALVHGIDTVMNYVHCCGQTMYTPLDETW